MDYKIIKDEDTYLKYLDIAKELMPKDPKKGSKDADTLDLLVLLISIYESQKYPIEQPDLISAIEFRMDQYS